MVEAKIVYATSNDPNYPPTAVLDGKPDSFWVSCGLYPQQMLISLARLTHVDRMSISAYNVRRIVLEKSTKSDATEFDVVTNQEANHTPGKLQNISVTKEQISAAHLRLTILEGHDHFCSLHSLIITSSDDGSSVAPPQQKKMKTPPTNYDREISQNNQDSIGAIQTVDGVSDFDNRDDDVMDELVANHMEDEVDYVDEEDVDNASTFTQHGGSTLITDFADDDDIEDISDK